jgi:cephalosporin hydroxylase
MTFPFGIKMSQTWPEANYIMDFIHKMKVKAFVEIGVHVGGLAAIMLAWESYTNKDFEYLGIEIDPGPLHPKIKPRILIEDCFNPDTREVVRFFVHSHALTFVYCDNGEKKREIIFYEPVLKPGDFIFAHDYGYEVLDEHVESLYETCDRVPPSALIGTKLIGFRKR